MPLGKEKALLIINPYAGKQAGKTNFYTIVSILSQKYDLTVHLTEYSGDARDTVATAEEFQTIICCGGDGTVSQVLEGAVGLSHPISIGYIPCGTTNDLASAVGLPKNIQAAAQTVVNGVPIPHDIGSFNGDRRFVYTATMGLFAATSYETPQEIKNVLGHFAYTVSGINELGNIRWYHLQVETESTKLDFQDVLFCSVLNTTSVGGILRLPGERVDFTDGKFELLIIRKPPDLFALNDLVVSLTKSDYSSPYISFLQASSFHFSIEGGAAWTIDGEAAGEQSEVWIACQPKQMNLIRLPSELAASTN
jgi:YegS/Rv2252/BmrU family lipid kinase